MRVGDYRIIFAIDDGVAMILRIGNRRDISNGGVVTTFENNKFLNGGTIV